MTLATMGLAERKVGEAVFVGVLLAGGMLHARQADFRFDRLGLEDGLSQSEVSAILQDRVGFMWFATHDGLNRYDGYRFTVHKSNPEDPSTISDNFITALCEPQHSPRWEIWVGTRAGLNQFDPHTGRFTRHLHDPARPESLSDNEVTEILEDRRGRLWIGTRRGLNLMVPSSTPGGPPGFIRFTSRPGDPTTLGSDVVNAIWQDRRSQRTVLWVGTDAGLNRLEVASGDDSPQPAVDVARYPPDAPEGGPLSTQPIHVLNQTADGTLWVGTQGGDFFRVEGFGGPARRHRVAVAAATPDITSFQERSGLVWIGTYGGGVHLFNPRDESLQTLRHRESDPTSISGDFVLSLYQDRDDRLWLGTTGAGVSLHTREKRYFASLRREPGNPNSLSNPSVLAIHEDIDGNIWVGTVEGLNRVDAKTRAVRQFRRAPSDRAGLPSDVVYALQTFPGAEREKLWVGTAEGLAILDVRSGRFTVFRHDPEDPRSLLHNRVQSILVDRMDRTWVGTDGGVSRFEPETGGFTHHVRDRDDPDSPFVRGVLRLYEDSRGRIWVATTHGVRMFDPESGQTVRHTADSAGLSDDLVYSFCETQGRDGKPVLWIGTRNGLTKLEIDAGRWTRYYEADGLPSAVVVGVLPDGSGHVWLSTFRGLSRFDPARETFRNFGPSDGLQSFEFNWGAYHRGRSGRLYFGGLQGVNWFDPDNLTFNPRPPPVVLTSIRVLNREREWGESVSTLRRLELPYHQNALSFEFAALDYTAPHQNQYAYRMEGVDPDWIESGNRRYASYTELRPGDYRFLVRGSNNDGVWNQEGVALDIRIHPPIWRTWPAYLLYALAAVGLAAGLERARARRLKISAELSLKQLEAEKLAEVDRLKSRFFTDVTHEFRTPLTLIQGSLERLRGGDADLSENLERIESNTRRLAAMIDQVLDLARLEAGQMTHRPAVEDLADFTRFVASCFASLAEARGIELVCDIPDSPVPVSFDGDQLEKCLSNLLTNALKFTPSGGRVSVSLGAFPRPASNFPGGYAELEVADSGVGIPEPELERIFVRFHQAREPLDGQAKGSGVGLALTRELVTLHGGEIRAHAGQGARFTIRLPLAAGQTAPSDRQRGTTQEAAGAPPLSPNADQAALASPSPEGPSTALPEIMIVDDNADIRSFLQEALESDYTVRPLADAGQALREAIESVPDLIVSDVMMPGLDGFEFCRRLRADERTSHVPIILLTAKAGRESRIEGLETGADDYLVKPFSQEELRARIRNLIARRRQLHAMYSRRIQLDPKDIAITSTDELFLRRVMRIVEERLSEADFGVAGLASAVGLSRVQLHRKIHALTGEPPGEFIRTTRLRLAARLLAGGQVNVTQAAYEVGFQNLSHFSKSFRERFGVSPSAYAKNPTEVG